MFIVRLSYQAPLAEIDQALAAHKAYLERHYAAGRFLVSGRLEPRAGGVILANLSDRAELDTVLSEDPFAQRGLAAYEVLEFHPTRWDSKLDGAFAAGA
jgi:uncharacterized protein YciI